jgi:hypothetical protein
LSHGLNTDRTRIRAGREVLLPERLVASMMRKRPLLRGLMAVGADYGVG